MSTQEKFVGLFSYNVLSTCCSIKELVMAGSPKDSEPEFIEVSPRGSSIRQLRPVVFTSFLASSRMEFWMVIEPSSIISNPSISSISQSVRDRDMTCRLSGCEDGIERAHLCPRSTIEWFKSQEMHRHNINHSLTGASSVDVLAIPM
jgi:hypothetical protein